jgi:Fe-S cluster biogenesis protein NfuA
MVINCPKKEMHQLFSTQLLSPNALYRVIKILKHKERDNAPVLARNNTRLVFVRWRPAFCVGTCSACPSSGSSTSITLQVAHALQHLVVDSALVLHIT